MDAAALLTVFAAAVERRDGAGFAALFAPDAVYHDVFYGPFEGREKIASMIHDWFYRDATAFRWDFHDPVSDGRTLYARYVFSFTSLLPEAGDGRVVFEGVAVMTLRDGLIASYREVAHVGTGFADLKFAPERTAKILQRHAAALRARPEAARHVAP